MSEIILGCMLVESLFESIFSIIYYRQLSYLRLLLNLTPVQLWKLLSCHQLENTKSHDGKRTLMHYLADVVEKKYPDLVNFTDELLHIEKAVRGKSADHLIDYWLTADSIASKQWTLNIIICRTQWVLKVVTFFDNYCSHYMFQVHWNPHTMLCSGSKPWNSDVSESAQPAL